MESTSLQKTLETLENAAVKPTANRILVLKTLIASGQPMSLLEIETALQTLDRSSILRVLTLFQQHDVIHSMEDGRGVSKYEVCNSCGGRCNDMHVHFFCERCSRTFCLPDNRIPHIEIPAGFTISSANFMLKGICPDCSAI